MSWHGDINKNIGNAEANALTEHEMELVREYTKRIIQARQPGVWGKPTVWEDPLHPVVKSKSKKEAS